MAYLFVHGLGQNSSSWDSTLASLSPLSAAHCPDLFALLSDGDKTYENLYRAFCAYCMKMEGPVNLCGLSLGAVLALNYAIDYPERAASLALIGAQYQMPRRLLALQNILFRLMPKAAFRQTGLQKAGMIQLTASMKSLDFSGNLKEVSCPVLVICGERDLFNKKASLELFQKLPRACLRIVEGAGHELNKEAPERLAKALESFYSGADVAVRQNGNHRR